MKNIVLLGAPGSGKGTQAEMIAKKYGVPQISTGEIFRSNIRAETALGIAAKEYIGSGRLVPDELTVNLVRDRLMSSDCEDGFILDGFPRNIPQADSLNEFLVEEKRPLSAVLSIYVPDDAIIVRLSGRRMCRECGKTYHTAYSPPQEADICDKCGGDLVQRDDDKEATVRERLSVYHAQTAPLIDYYTAAGLFIQITGRELVSDTTSEMTAALNKIFGV